MRRSTTTGSERSSSSNGRFEHWIERHARRDEAVTRAVPADRLRRGHALARALVADGGVPVLLHGDLHPGNVLDGGTGAAADEVAALLALARPEDRSSYHSISCATKRRSV